MLSPRLEVCLALLLQSKPWVPCGTSRLVRAAVTRPSVPWSVRGEGIVCGTTTSFLVLAKECAHFRSRKHVEPRRPKPYCPSQERSTIERSAEWVGTVALLCA